MSNKLYLDYTAIEGYAQAIAREIMLDAKDGLWKPDYIVGLTRGGLLPATLLSQYLNIPMCSLDISLRDSTLGPTSNAWMAVDAFEGKNILIVDDINDTGATLEWIIDDWPAGCMPHHKKWNDVWGDNVRFAVTVHNKASNFQNISYYGQSINKMEHDVWVVFPWEDWWMPKP